MRVIRILLVVAASLPVRAAGAAAQLSSVPFFYEPSRTSAGRLSAGLAVGSGVNDGSSRDWSWGAVLRMQVVSRLAVSGSGGVVYVDDLAGGSSARAQLSGQVEALLVDSPLRVSVLGGIGYASLGRDESEVNLPLGVGFSRGVSILGSNLELWAVPRYALRRISAGARAASQHGGGVSGGVGIGGNRPVGVGLGVDWSRLGEARDGEFFFPGADRWIVGGWVRYRFSR